MGTAPRQSHTYLSTIGDKGGDLTLDGHVAGVLQTAERTHYQPPTGNWGLGADAGRLLAHGPLVSKALCAPQVGVSCGLDRGSS